MGETKHLPALFTSTSQHNGQGNEGHGSNESHARHEEEGCEQDCKGSLFQGPRLPWIQVQDHGRLEQERSGEEQEWQDLDFRSPEGKEGPWSEGLRRYQEGLSSLQ